MSYPEKNEIVVDRVFTGKYITVSKSPVDARLWNIYNKKNHVLLGWIGYFSKWRKYVFSAVSSDIVFDSQCLTDIAGILTEIGNG